MKKYIIGQKRPLPSHILIYISVLLFVSVQVSSIFTPQVAKAAPVRQNSTTCSNTGATTIACTVTAPTNGNAQVAVIGTRGTAANTVSSITQTGATWARATQGTNTNGVTLEIWYSLNVSSAGTSVTINLGSSLKASAIVAEYSGIATASALDKTANNTGNGTSVTSGTTATTAQANQLWIGGFANINTNTYSAETNSFAELAESASTTGGPTTQVNSVFEERIVSATGTASVGATLSGTQQWAGAIATFSGPAPPTKIAFTTSARTITAGTCSGAANIITIQLQNASSTPTNPTGATTVRVTSNSPTTEAIYSDSGCTNQLTNGDISFTTSENTKSFYIIDTRKSIPTWTLTATKQSGPDTLTDGTQSITVNAAAVARLQITLPGQSFTDGTGVSGSPSNRTAGSGFNITSISATDNYNNVNTGYSGAKTLVYSGPGNAPDTTAPSYTTSVSFTNGVSTTTLATTLYRAESTTITATDTGSYGYASSSVTVDPNILDHLLITEAASSFVAGVCQTGTIVAQDAWDNSRTTDSSLINMTDTGSSVNFYTTNGCSTGTTQYTLASGTANMYYTSTIKQGNFTITGTKDSDTPTGTSGNILVYPAAANALLIRLPGQSFVDGTGITGGSNFTGTRTPNATAGTSFNVDIKAIDAYNNLVDSGPNNYTGSKTISWADSVAGNAPDTTGPSFPGSVSFTNGEANTQTITYYNATTGRTVEADDTGTPVSGTASSSFTVQANVNQNYAVSASTPQTAGVAFNVTVTARDDWNNVLGALYSAPAGTYTWTTTASNAPDTTAPSIGTLAQGDFSSGVATKSVTLYAAEAGVTFTATEPSAGPTGTSGGVTVDPGVINNYLVSATTPGTAGGCISGSTITARDAWNNTRTTDTTVVNMTTSGTGLTFYTAAGCGTSTTQYTMSGGTANVYFRTDKKQSGITITATKVSDTPTGTSGAITINPAIANNLVIKLPGETFTDGSGISGSINFSGLRSPNATAGTSFSIDVYGVDSYGNVVDSGPNNYNGTFNVTYLGSVAGNAPDSTSPSFPTTSLTFTNGAALGLNLTYYNAATARNVDITDNTNFIVGFSNDFTVQANVNQNYAVSASTPQTAGVAFNVTVTARDDWNNVLGALYSAPAGTYTWTTTASNAPDTTAPSIGTLAQGDFSSGVATKSVTLYAAEAGVTFTATEPSAGPTGTSGGVTVNPGNVSAATGDSTISGNSTVTVGNPLVVTITLRDTWRNPVSGVNSGYIVVSGTGSPTVNQPSSNTDANGQTTADLTWAGTGAKTVSVQINTITLVQNDGSTPDADSYLDDTLGVTVNLPAADARVRGGATIRGGTIFQ